MNAMMLLAAAGLMAVLPNSTPAQGQTPASTSRPRLEQVIVVFKTHFDIGYTDMASNVVRRYRTTMIDDALKVVEQNRNLPPEQRFVWTLPGWPLSQIMADWPGQTPDRKAKVQQAFKEGRFVVHALAFTTHTELLEPEDLVRGLGFASRLSRAASLELPRDAKMTDVPCHSWILPTLLRHAGVDFLHLGCNAASSSPRVPRLFFWEGPDGSRLLTMYTAESYGTGLVPPKDWPYKTWLALIHTGDNHGPPTPDEVKQLLEEAKKKLPGIKVRIGRLSDFADAILAETSGGRVPRIPIPELPGTRGARPSQSANGIPVVRGDMPDTWIHGPMCDPAGARLAKNMRPAIMMAEALSAQLDRFWGVRVPDPAPTIAAAYEGSLLYGEHTWGGALYWVTKYGSGTKWGYGDTWKADHAAGRFQRLEDSWAEHTSYIESARDLITPVLENELGSLAKAVKAEGRRFVVYNPLPWKRDGVVTLKIGPEAIQAVRPADGKEILPVATHNGMLHFVARAIPSMGYRTYVPVETKLASSKLTSDSKTATLDGSFFKAVLDPERGTIRSLIDKRSKRELADTGAPQGFGQYLYERFDSNIVAGYVKAYVKINADWAINELGKPSLPPASEVPYRAASPKFSKLHFEGTPAATTAVMEAPPGADLAHGVTTRITLYRDLPCVDLEITLQDKPADPWPEAGWICLPFRMNSPKFRVGRLGSIIDPTTDIVPGANPYLLGVNTGVALFDAKGRGVGFCPIDSPLVSLDTPGCWKYSVDFVPKEPVAYVNLFNNQWTTNFRLWNQGTWTYRVRLWAFDRFQNEAALITPSLEARFPLLGAMTHGAAGDLPPSQPGLELSRKGVLVTALGPDDGRSFLRLRLWELAGESGSCRVQLPTSSLRDRFALDLRDRITGPEVPWKRAGFTVSLRSFAPASYGFGNRFATSGNVGGLK